MYRTRIPSQGKRVPLKVRHLWTGDENVLSSSGSRLLLLDLQLHNFGRMLNDLGDKRNMTRPNFTQNALRDPYNAASYPIFLDDINPGAAANRVYVTYPENTNIFPRAIRWPIGLDHTEHSMQLPTDEVDDEHVVRVPKALKVFTSFLLPGEKHDDKQCGCHDPTGDTRSRSEIDSEERSKLLTARLRIRVGDGELGKVDHVREDVDGRANDHRPARCLMKRDVLVEGYKRIERGATKEGDEVPADGEQDEYDINMKHERSRSSSS